MMPMEGRLRESALSKYLLPVVSVSTAAALRLYFDPSLTWKAPFVFFILAILLSARIGGFAPGLLATGLSTSIGIYLFGVRHPDGVNVALITLTGAGISLICGQLRDALERSRVEQKRLRAIADTLPQLLWTSDSWGECNFVNARWTEFSGAEPNDVKAWTAHVHPDDLPRLAITGTATTLPKAPSRYGCGERMASTSGLNSGWGHFPIHRADLPSGWDR